MTTAAAAAAGMLTLLTGGTIGAGADAGREARAGFDACPAAARGAAAGRTVVAVAEAGRATAVGAVGVAGVAGADIAGFSALTAAVVAFA